MPNYYIQAKRGTFNPFSFDEYVKPLNMYKEYYEKNEQAITDMQEQANLWKNIMESEKDSKLAEKYNTYVNNLNNATQQLKNGMSYNLRNQIQQLRGQSAMVKQIENAYNLRAKDIDTYNELMLKDPSRIGAYDPSQRKLQEYLNGPVTNEYGVSGDRLYSLGNARAKAMSAQKNVFEKPVSVLGKQYFELKEKTGFSDEEITQMLKEHNPEIFNEIDRIIQQEGTSLNNANDLNRAETYVLNGMLSGFTFNEDRKYLKDDSYMNPWEIAKTQLDIDKKTLERDILQLKYDEEAKKNFGLSRKQLTEAYTGNNVGLFSAQLPKDFTENEFDKILNKWATNNDNKEGYQFNNNGEFTTKSIADYNKLSDNQKQELTNYVDDFLTRNNRDEYSAIELIARRNDLKEIFGNKNMSDSELNKYIDLYKDAQKDKLNISAINSFVDSYNIPGSSKEEQYKNLLNFINESSQIKNYGGLNYLNSTGKNNVLNILRTTLKADDGFQLQEVGTNDELSHEKSVDKLKGDFFMMPSRNGYLLTDAKGVSYNIKNSNSNLITGLNKDTFALNTFVRNPFDIVSKFENENGEIPNRIGNKISMIENSNIAYTLYKKDNKLYARIINAITGGYVDMEMYNAGNWEQVSSDLIFDEAEKLKKQSSNN